jgi:phenylacetate-CoA ligase
MAKKRHTSDLLARLERMAFPSDHARQMLALQVNLEASQWWSASKVARFQEAQLGSLLTHAYARVPHYRTILDDVGLRPESPVDWKRWRDLPLLKRDLLQNEGAKLRAHELPPGHEEIDWLRSSGSTGRAVEVMTTNVNDLWQKTLTLRNQIWANRDFGRTMGVIRKLPPDEAPPPDGDRLESWGDETSFPFPTGPCVRLSAAAEIGEQNAWLERLRPDYLTTYPSILRELAASPPTETGGPFPIKGVSTLGETVDQELRDLVEQHWNCRVFDAYSAEEVGCIAVECPKAGGYHVQAEATLVEVLDAEGKPCRPGDMGEVVVTPLFNYAMPLLRYAIGDYAEVGDPCRCGRGGLPLLKRILGRQRNMLVLGDGRVYWPSFGTRAFAQIGPILQQQFHQSAPDRLEVRLVVREPLSNSQEEALKEKIQQALPAPFQISLDYVDEILRDAGGKFELFTSAVAASRHRRSATISA